jgi:hypothetical protein
MTTPPSSEFSYDLYPGLDAELQAALERNIVSGNANPAEIATAGLAAAVANTVAQPQLTGEWTSIEAQQWATNELGSAQRSWLEYSLDTENLDGLDALIATEREKMSRLYDARQDLIASAGETPEGANIGESMHLTLVPWRMMLDNLTRLPEWVKEMRSVQGIATVDDYFNPDLLQHLQGANIYRNPDWSPHGQGEAEWQRARDYLARRVLKDGPWGIVLTQTSNDAGMSSMVGKSPDELTQNGSKHLEVNGQRVDGLGALEWLAMTLQHNPAELSASDGSWLLANRLDVNGVARVPCGRWVGSRVRSGLDVADNRYDGIRPRLAVI